MKELGGGPQGRAWKRNLVPKHDCNYYIIFRESKIPREQRTHVRKSALGADFQYEHQNYPQLGLETQETREPSPALFL